MNWIRDILNDSKKIDRSPGIMRKFGIVLSIVLLVLGGMLCWKHRHEGFFTSTSIIFLVFAAISLCLALMAPRLLKPVNVVFTVIAMIIGWFLTRFTLAFLFYFIFLPVGIVMKMISRDSMKRKFDKNAETYWEMRQDEVFDPERCKRLF